MCELLIEMLGADGTVLIIHCSVQFCVRCYRGGLSS